MKQCASAAVMNVVKKKTKKGNKQLIIVKLVVKLMKIVYKNIMKKNLKICKKENQKNIMNRKYKIHFRKIN